jgi:hypothetical protein
MGEYWDTAGMEPPEVTDVEVAQKLAWEFLLSSFVCDVGWFGGNPTLRFANENIPNEVWLSMCGGFAVTPSPDLPATLTHRQRSLLSLESILGYEVKSVRCHPDGRLEIIFANATLLFALDDNPDEYECWQMRTDKSGLIVATHGGGFAVWQPSSAPTN